AHKRLEQTAHLQHGRHHTISVHLRSCPFQYSPTLFPYERSWTLDQNWFQDQVDPPSGYKEYAAESFLQIRLSRLKVQIRGYHWYRPDRNCRSWPSWLYLLPDPDRHLHR